MSRRLNVGVIGCGGVTRSIHLEILARTADVQVVALAEPDLPRRQAAGRRVPGALACADYAELVKRPEVEAVFICVPPALHAEVAVAAFERGKHVYLEKPLATNPDEARDVLTAWKRAGVVGMIGFNYRFNPLFEAIAPHIRSGRLGPLVGVRSVFSTAAKDMPAWKQTRDRGGGVLLDLASHHVDLLHFWLDQEIRQVYAELRSLRSEDDTAMLQLRLADGLPVQSFLSLCSVEEDRVEICGQHAKLAIDRYGPWGVSIIEAGREFSLLDRTARGLSALAHTPYALRKRLAVGHEPSYRRAVRQFIGAVRGDARATPDLEDGYRCLEVISGAEQSARTGRAVALARGSRVPSGGKEER